MDLYLFTKDPFTDYLKIASAVVVSLEVDRTSPGLRHYVGVFSVSILRDYRVLVESRIPFKPMLGVEPLHFLFTLMNILN